MTLEADFLTTAADKLAENLDRIETCLARTAAPLPVGTRFGKREWGRQFAAASGRQRATVDSVRRWRWTRYT